MVESSAPSPEILTDGGFRIEIAPDELTITSIAPKLRKLLPIQLFIALLVVVCFFNSIVIGLVMLIAFWEDWLIPLWRITGGVQRLRCTAETMEFTLSWNSQLFKKKAISREKIEEIVFCGLGFLGWSSSAGLSFLAFGRRTRLLIGLRAPEGSRILSELHKLGYDTVRDPALPGMIEAEMTRRSSRFYLWTH